LKMVKHCHECLPTMVTGSLLGLDVNNTLEVTYAYPFPSAKSDLGDAEAKAAFDGQEYQIEMMKLLRDVNIENNCVGWYQSMYLGTMMTAEVVAHQYNYQISEELSDNSILIAYDAVQSANGQLVLKAFRLSAEFIEAKKNKVNKFIKPANILEELPVRIKNGGLISAFLRDLNDSAAAGAAETAHSPYATAVALNDCKFSSLSMDNSELYLERQLDLMRLRMEDLVDAQQQFQQHAKHSVKPRLDHVRFLTKRAQDNAIKRENGEDELPMTTAPIVSPSGVVVADGLKPLPEAPGRAETLLTLQQLSNYCNQINAQVQNNYKNLYIASQVCGTAGNA
jgi:translation initiation factor 3 subunit H